MKEIRDILTILASIAVELGHKLRIVYIPEKDAMPWPFDLEPEPEPVTVKPVQRPENVRTRVIAGDMFTPDRTFQQLEEFYDMEGGAAWDLRRYDGKEGMPDFTDWHPTDDQILSLHGYTKQTAKNYVRVRPFVVQGLSNKEIAARTGMGLRTVESVAGSVRAAFRMRIEQAVNPSPTGERGEEDTNPPQMTANSLKPA